MTAKDRIRAREDARKPKPVKAPKRAPKPVEAEPVEAEPADVPADAPTPEMPE